MKPLIAQAITIGIGAVAGIQCQRLAGLRRDDLMVDRSVSVYVGYGGVIGFVKRLQRPVHTRGKVVLKGFTPAPNGRLIRCVLVAINTGNGIFGIDAVKQVTTLCPDSAWFAGGLPPQIAAAPASPTGVAKSIQSIGD